MSDQQRDQQSQQRQTGFAALKEHVLANKLETTQNSWWGARLLISVVEFQTRNILRLAACSEILIMPITVLLVFFGKAGIMTPLVYYQFLVMRYSSRRNPYTRNMFYEFRLVAENFANGASTPPVLRKGLHAAIGFISRLAPPTVVQPQQQGQ